MPVVEYPYGNKPQSVNKNRSCQFCGKKLSRYNLNKFCFAHSGLGFDFRSEELETKRMKAYEIQKEYIIRKSKERRNGTRR